MALYQCGCDMIFDMQEESSSGSEYSGPTSRTASDGEHEVEGGRHHFQQVQYLRDTNFE